MYLSDVPIYELTHDTLKSYTDWAFTGPESGMTDQQFSTVSVFIRVYVRIAHLGDCIGVDAQVKHLCDQFHVFTHGHPADNVHPSKKAGLEYDVGHEPAPALDRNENMVVAAQALVAVPAERHEVLRSGTWATIRRAWKHGRPVMYVWPDGSLSTQGFPAPDMRPPIGENND